MNLNVSANSGRSSHASPMMGLQHHHHHLMHGSGSGFQSQSQHQPSSTTSLGGGGLLLHQPHINSSSLSTTNHKCTIIGCQATSFKSKSQLLRHYSTAHGIGINSNNSNNSSAIITLTSNNVDGNTNEILSSQQKHANSNAGHHQNSSGPLNLNSNSNSIQHSNSSSGTVNQVINLVATSLSPQSQPNNLSISGLASTNALGAGVAMTASGRPVMKTRTAFYLRCTSLAKASRRRAAHQAAIALLQQQHHKKKSNGSSTAAMLSPTASTLVQPGCLARPRNVARRPFICVPQAAHSYKHECMYIYILLFNVHKLENI